MSVGCEVGTSVQKGYRQRCGRIPSFCVTAAPQPSGALHPSLSLSLLVLVERFLAPRLSHSSPAVILRLLRVRLSAHFLHSLYFASLCAAAAPARVCQTACQYARLCMCLCSRRAHYNATRTNTKPLHFLLSAHNAFSFHNHRITHIGARVQFQVFSRSHFRRLFISLKPTNHPLLSRARLFLSLPPRVNHGHHVRGVLGEAGPPG